jgi:hypothetical protein
MLIKLLHRSKQVLLVLWLASSGLLMSVSTASAQWSDWENLGGVLTSGPTAASWGANRLDVFVRGLDGAMWHKWWNGSSWSDWENLGGALTTDPDCVSWSLNRIDCFVRGVDNALWHKWWDGSSWSGWENLGGVLTSGPTAASWGANRLDVFVRGLDNAMWHKWWNGSSWSDWENLGGALTTDPDCVSWSLNRIDCFVRGVDNALWHKWWDGSSWSGWENLGGVLTSGPTAASWGANRLDVFVRGLDGAMWHKWWNGSNWSDWENLGGALTSDPDCVSWSLNRVDCFVRGPANALWHKWWPTAGPGPGPTTDIAQISVDRGCGGFYNHGDPIAISYTLTAPASVMIYDFDPAGVLQPVSVGFRSPGTYTISGVVRGQGVETLAIQATTGSGVAMASCSFAVGVSPLLLSAVSVNVDHGCGGAYGAGEHFTVSYSVSQPVIRVRIFAIVPGGVNNMTPVPLVAASGSLTSTEVIGPTRGDRMVVVVAVTPVGILSATCKYRVP